MRRIAFLVGASLGACVLSPANDPHNQAHNVFPGKSPDVYQYTTTQYPSLYDPPVYAPTGGGSVPGGRPTGGRPMGGSPPGAGTTGDTPIGGPAPSAPHRDHTRTAPPPSPTC